VAAAYIGWTLRARRAAWQAEQKIIQFIGEADGSYQSESGHLDWIDRCGQPRPRVVSVTLHFEPGPVTSEGHAIPPYEGVVNDEWMTHLSTLSHLRELQITNQPLRGKGLKELANSFKLRTLDLSDCKLETGALAHLQPLTNLEVLKLNYASITNSDLESISALRSLKSLELSGNIISDDGLQHLSKLTNLVSLELRSSSETFQITDTGLAHLTPLTNLKALDLSFTKVSDEGLRVIANFAKLKRLKINNTQVTDKGLEHLSALKNLHALNLNSLSIKGHGLKHLEGLTQLSELRTLLDVNSTKELAELQRALPKLKIIAPAPP
jgi:Leucine-rich repeat (LRR) protein